MFFQVCRPELWVDTREVALLTGRNTNRLKTKEEVKLQRKAVSQHLKKEQV